MLATYLLIRLFTLPFAFLPYRAIHACGRLLGTLVYHLVPGYRKRALSNLALALKLPNKEIRTLAKKSLQTLATTCLEYPKLAREKQIHRIAECENPETAESLISKGQGVIFFCGHQSNWELLFLEGTSRMPGAAIGRPTKNHYLYDWIQSIRQKFGGTMLPRKDAIRGGLKALREGKFLGIVGDQALPESGYSSLFLGRLAWTSPLPALLAYKTNSPLFVATTRYEKGKYRIRYSEPLYPNPQPQKTKRSVASWTGR
jgi:Kdo2-lipid IVA lauroyltransferase/acyltransferase